MPDVKPLQKVLIANRGEIAVRVIRACKDAGIGSVAVYADPDRDALFVRLADEAHSPRRRDAGRLLPRHREDRRGRRRSPAPTRCTRATASSPRTRDFAQAVLDAGLVWIGPPPAAIENLGDKAKASHIAEKAGAPLAPGTKDPVEDADEVVAFAEENGLPDRDQGRLRRRRPRPQGRPHDRGDPRRLRVRGPRGRSAPSAAASAWSRSSSTSRATSRPSASPTSTATSSSSPPATARCSAATRSWSRRRPRRSSPTTRSAALYESSKAILREAQLRRRRHLRVPRRRGRHHLLPRGQHPPPGRALRLRGGHRHRPGPRDVPDRRGRGARVRRPARSTATRSSSASTPRTAAATSCPPPAP